MSDLQVYLPPAAGLFGLSTAGQRAVHHRPERAPDSGPAPDGGAKNPTSPERAACDAEGDASCSS